MSFANAEAQCMPHTLPCTPSSDTVTACICWEPGRPAILLSSGFHNRAALVLTAPGAARELHLRGVW